MPVGEEHFTRELEVLPLVRVRNIQCLCSTVVLCGDRMGGQRLRVGKEL